VNLPDGTPLPYLVAIGNHDYINGDSSSFDTNIGYIRLNQKKWYAGYWAAPDGSQANQAIMFNAQGRQLLIIALEHMPRQGAIDWAQNLIISNPDYSVIIITHFYMTVHGVLPINTDPYMWPGNSAQYGGQELCDWAKTFSNIKAILCGHSLPQTGTEEGTNHYHRVDMAWDGHPLIGIYTDYQVGFGDDKTVPADANGCVGPGGQLPSQVVLLLELSDFQMNVRAFNTTTGEEQFSPHYPYVLPWSW
jgi:hypothetical protein